MFRLIVIIIQFLSPNLVYSELPDKALFCKSDGVANFFCKRARHLYCSQPESVSKPFTPLPDRYKRETTAATVSSSENVAVTENGKTTVLGPTDSATSEPNTTPRVFDQFNLLDANPHLKVSVLSSHNDFRDFMMNCDLRERQLTNVKGEDIPIPIKLMKLRWDSDLAKLASLRAQTCNIDLEPDCAITNEYMSLGQNQIFKTFKKPQTYQDLQKSILEAIHNWFLEFLTISETSLLNKNSKGIPIPREFGFRIKERYPSFDLTMLEESKHFKVMVSDELEKIGCALADCSKGNSTYMESYFFVCNYGTNRKTYNQMDHDLVYAFGNSSKKDKCDLDSHSFLFCCLCLQVDENDQDVTKCSQNQYDFMEFNPDEYYTDPPTTIRNEIDISKETTESKENEGNEATNSESMTTTTVVRSSREPTTEISSVIHTQTEETKRTEQSTTIEIETTTKVTGTTEYITTDNTDTSGSIDTSENPSSMSSNNTSKANFLFSKYSRKLILASLFIL